MAARKKLGYTWWPRRPRTKERSMRRIGALLVMTTLLLIFPAAPSANAAGQKTTDSLGQLQVWTANMRLFTRKALQSGEWRKFVDRITNPDIPNHDYMPDIVLVQEITRVHADNFVNYLSRKAGATYRWRHAKLPTSNIKGGGTWKMVVWRAGRLKLATGTKNDVFRWAELRRVEGTKNCKREASRPSIAVRLKDTKLNQTVAAASVHWSPHPSGSARICGLQNTRRSERLLEKQWPQRDLTLVGGDFNRVPQDGEDPADGRETNPDCWYRHVFGMYSETDDTSSCDGDAPGPLSYYDPVYLAHSGSDGSTEFSICHQWTHARSKGPDGSHACQDSPGDDDNKRDKSRIDYIWVRWETPDGKVETPSVVDARARVPYAGADQINWAETQPYSDHRGVGARVQV